MKNSERNKKYSLAVLALHPVQYHASFYRALHTNSKIQEMVYFLDDTSLKEFYCEEFKTAIKWDLPLLEKYNFKFLKNYNINKDSFLASRINPSIIQALTRKRYHAVIITGYNTISALVAIFISKLRGIKILFRTEADLGNISNRTRIFLKRLFLKKLLSICDIVLYSCNKNKEYFKFYGIPEGKMFPILSSVDNKFFQNEHKKYRNKGQLKIELGIPASSVLFLFIGRLAARKRPMDILKAFYILQSRQQFNNLHLIFVGHGPLMEDMRSFVHLRNLKHVIFAGFKNLSEIPKYYATSDVFILPSEYDPTPKVVNEALNFRLPVILSNTVGTANDLVQHGINGYVFEKGNIKEIAYYMSKFAADQGMIDKMGQRSLKIVNFWSPEQNVNSVVDALDYCL